MPLEAVRRPAVRDRVVGAALLWTLEQGLGAAFNDATREAWATAYGILATTMMNAVELAEAA